MSLCLAWQHNLIEYIGHTRGCKAALCGAGSASQQAGKGGAEGQSGESPGPVQGLQQPHQCAAGPQAAAPQTRPGLCKVYFSPLVLQHGCVSEECPLSDLIGDCQVGDSDVCLKLAIIHQPLIQNDSSTHSHFAAAKAMPDVFAHLQTRHDGVGIACMI